MEEGIEEGMKEGIEEGMEERMEEEKTHNTKQRESIKKINTNYIFFNFLFNIHFLLNVEVGSTNIHEVVHPFM